MIGATVRWELVLLRRSAAAMLPTLCLGALVLLSFLSIAVVDIRDNHERVTVAAAERERWLNQSAKDAHSAAHFSVFAFKPAPALAALDPGIADFVGQSVWLEAHHQDDMLYRAAQDASPLQRMGRSDPTGLLIVFGPMVAFVLAFGAVARERDTGTLRLALGVATSPVRLLGAKALAIWAALGTTLLLPVVVLAPVAATLGGA